MDSLLSRLQGVSFAVKLFVFQLSGKRHCLIFLADIENHHFSLNVHEIHMLDACEVNRPQNRTLLGNC